MEYYDINGGKEKTLHENYNDEEDVFEQETLDGLNLFKNAMWRSLVGFAM